ncbi:MARVEL superfamily domain-containing protein [Histoplasma capsulatum var. duboisii H88]|uniref:MARVEL superfamily domain-containing protein n=1 Tax=Ajellomyces capsulatus (strain H88) TaxID=544711 RepID=A0A8A1LSB8_AJEC8|nr:MARVEL superfamily domain-containing protein [Histoplasma capsulatum var. duboisii H88]
MPAIPANDVGRPPQPNPRISWDVGICLLYPFPPRLLWVHRQRYLWMAVWLSPARPVTHRTFTSGRVST